jgi:hypothetical protein
LLRYSIPQFALPATHAGPSTRLSARTGRDAKADLTGYVPPGHH